MKITQENISSIPVSSKEQGLLNSLLIDLEDINKSKFREEIYVDWQDYHNECSPEWVDPCPDYYGYYTIRSINDPYEILGIEMTIEDLDMTLCLLYNYVVDL